MLQKLLSRKLWVAVATLLTIVLDYEDPVRAGVGAAVGIAYILGEAFVDRASVNRVASGAEEGIARAREITKPPVPPTA